MLVGFRDVIAAIGTEGEACNQSSAELRLSFTVQSLVHVVQIVQFAEKEAHIAFI